MWRRAAKCLVLLLAVLFAMPTVFVLGASPASSIVRSVTGTIGNDMGSMHVNPALAKLESAGVPSSDIFLPAAHRSFTFTNGVVQPLYTQAPAPMGVGDMGLMTVNGRLVGYNIETSSVKGTITVNGMNAYDLTSGAQGVGTIQLNTVVTNVTLFGVTSQNYSYWTQNVVVFRDNFHIMHFVLNIWNFSTPTFAFPPNGIAKGRGHVFGNEVYITGGPTFTGLTYPVTVDLYTNTTVIDGNSTVFFNYTVQDATLNNGRPMSGTYDEVEFNSTWGMPSSFSAPMPYYLISGTKVTPTNFLLYDAEIMIGGGGGGSNDDITGISATMHLSYLSSGSFVTVPSAFDFGTDTGETSTGVNVWWQGTTAIANPGPSLLYGMWNIATSPPVDYSGVVTPSNAFMFVSPGQYVNLQMDAWVPLGLEGTYNFHVPYSSLATQILLSFYSPVNSILLPGARDFTLMSNPGIGIYTPLFAFDNQQVAALAQSGSGMPGSPYVITARSALIAQQFAEFNDYLFPVFTGVFFTDVNAPTELMNLPPLVTVYPFSIASADGLPSYINILGFVFYNDYGITLWGVRTGGYLTDTQFPYSIILLDSSHMLVASSTIYATGGHSIDSHRVGGGMIISGGGGNVVWGNVFNPGIFVIGGSGLTVLSGGNLIYNNLFNYGVFPTAISHRPYVNRWNVEQQPADVASIFNGISLEGSIVGGPYQGGNWWWNYYGVVPYNDFGTIAIGGDFVPLNLFVPQLS